QTLLQRAIAHHQANRLDEAVRLYRAVLDADPDQADAHNNLGLALQQLGNAEEAGAHVEIALERKPFWPTPYLNLGQLLRDRGRGLLPPGGAARPGPGPAPRPPRPAAPGTGPTRRGAHLVAAGGSAVPGGADLPLRPGRRALRTGAARRGGRRLPRGGAVTAR